MKNVSFAGQLRHGLSGGVLLLALYVLSPNNLEQLSQSLTVGKSAIILASAFVVGALVYMLYSALLYPLVYRAFLARQEGAELTSPYSPSKYELGRDTKRWDVGNEALSEWAAQVHLLYCCFLALLIGVILAGLAPGRVDVQALYLCVVLLLLLATAAVVHHYRYLEFDYYVLNQNRTSAAPRAAKRTKKKTKKKVKKARRRQAA